MAETRQNNPSFYRARKTFDLKDQNSGGVFGRSINDYEVYRTTDVSNLTHVKGYIVSVRQRLVIPNQNAYIAGASSTVAFKNYPAIIQNTVKLDVNNKATIRLNSSFPKTLNANITTSTSTEEGSSKSKTTQHTSGSNTTNVNTFGVGIAGGIFAGEPLATLELSYSHSWIHEHLKSQMQAATSQSHQSASNSSSMSVKDWSSYSNLSTDHSTLSWLWGQSYPWDVILYNHATSGDNIELPAFIQERLLVDGLLVPPSELSLFGVDFTSYADWLIEYPEGIAADETVTINHDTLLYTASHSLTNNQVTGTLQSAKEASQASYSLGALDLSEYALTTLGSYQTQRAATVGFGVDPFTYAPTKPTDKFKIVSPICNLQVKGTGFDGNMQSTLNPAPALTVNFKIEEFAFNHTLLMVHWLQEGSDDCRVEWTINGKFSGSSILQGQGSNDNQQKETRVILRDTDYESVNFHDYLVLGMNSISITVSPADPKKVNCHYTLSSVTII